LLVAATLPPVGRIMALSRIGEIVTVPERPGELLELSVNQFDSNFHPRGFQYLGHFELGDSARFEYMVEGIRIVKEVQLCWMRNIVGVRYTIEPDRQRVVKLALLPFVAMRDFHGARHFDGRSPQVQIEMTKVRVRDDKNTLYLQSDSGTIEPAGDWWYGHTWSIEAERGLDDKEDLFCPARMVFETDRKATITIWAGTEEFENPNWDEELKKRPDPCTHASKANCENPSRDIRRLMRAAADFIVARKTPDGAPGHTIIAGYPWFADWGRDI
jgi:predicted glycogen debranching enzyme